MNIQRIRASAGVSKVGDLLHLRISFRIPKRCRLPGRRFRAREVLQPQEPELTISEIAGRAGLDAGTAFRPVKTPVVPGVPTAGAGHQTIPLDWKVPDFKRHWPDGRSRGGASAPALAGGTGERSAARSAGQVSGIEAGRLAQRQPEPERGVPEDESMLPAHPQNKGVVAGCDPMAPGVPAALKAVEGTT
jgi:hypothetical protein